MQPDTLLVVTTDKLIDIMFHTLSNEVFYFRLPYEKQSKFKLVFFFLFFNRI